MEGAKIMIDYSDVRIFLCTTPTKMTYSFDGLMGRAQEVFEQDPTTGHLFLFLNRGRDRIKILFWDRDGFCIWYKRLERGTFQLLTTTNDEEGVHIAPHRSMKLRIHCHCVSVDAFCLYYCQQDVGEPFREKSSDSDNNTTYTSYCSET